jgi:MFS family permease
MPTAERLAPPTLEPARGAAAPSLTRVVAASSVGTLIEFYDFFIFASLASVLSTQFYPPGDPTFSFLSTLATFAVGVAVRPLGALIFGRLGDTLGRKTTFLITLLIMGGATAAIGLLPGYATIGVAAPIILLVLRMLQGLALGGEYAGAATYVAEHAPEHRRGYYTSFIQAMPTLGILASTVTVLATQRFAGEQAFTAGAWRIPFLLSVLLVGVSYYMRRRLTESPIFTALKSRGETSSAPIAESFGSLSRWRLPLVILFGVAAGQAVLSYTSQVYILFFLQRTLKLPAATCYAVLAGALALCIPVIILVGAVSDRVGRKWLMIAGNGLGALTLYPLYRAITAYSNPVQPGMLTLLVFLQMLPLAIVFGPYAAFLVEAFPARIRYTSISLPFHIGNGWFGGFLPLIASAIVTRTGEPLSWLAYPITVLVVTCIVGGVFVTEGYRRRLWDEFSPTRS